MQPHVELLLLDVIERYPVLELWRSDENGGAVEALGVV